MTESSLSIQKRELQHMNKPRSADKTYYKEFGGAIVAYLISVPLSVFLIKASPTTAWWRIPLALIPVVPTLLAVLAFLRFFHRMDELQRRIQLEAFAFSFGGTGLLTLSYGFLERVGFPHIDWSFTLPLLITLWFIGLILASWRYQ
jgi:hypothetical protein